MLPLLKKRGSQGEVIYNEVNMEIEDIFALRLGLSSFWEIREVKFVQEPEGGKTLHGCIDLKKTMM